MTGSEAPRLERMLPFAIGAAAVLFGCLVIPMGLHSDDRTIVETTAASRYGELWTSSFFGSFYRPLVTTLMKASLDLFGTVRWTLRMLQASLLVATVARFATYARTRSGAWGTAVGTLFLLGSPMTFVTITPYAVGVADTIVGFVMMCTVVACLDAAELDTRTLAWLALGSVVAMLSKESGVLVAAYVAMECARRRDRVGSLVFVGLVALFVLVRRSILAEQDFPFATGYFFDTYDPPALERTFGRFPYPIYAYDVLSNLSLGLFGMPTHGNLSLRPSDGVRGLLFVATLAVIVRYLRRDAQWRRYLPLLALFLLNACVGYLYVRPRIMFTAHVAASVLVAAGAADLARESGRILGVRARDWLAVLALAWGLALGNATSHVVKQGRLLREGTGAAASRALVEPREDVV